jgi:uncharacterized surface protein with fasciclin (FAS1) repeats
MFGYGNKDPPGFGNNSPEMTPFIPDWKIVDKVQVPEGLSGDYVVSWRWDSEQTPQVWTSCAIVTIVDPENLLGDGGESGSAEEGDGSMGDEMSDGMGDETGDGMGDEMGDGSEECKSLIDVVCNSGAFALFCDALKAAELDSAFDKESWTFFIPNDAAFENIGKELELLSDDQIANILMFHVVEGEILTSDDLECKGKVTMFQGQNSRTKCDDAGIFQKGGGNKLLLFNPRIIQTNIEFCNGIAHVLDGVMLPDDFNE